MFPRKLTCAEVPSQSNSAGYSRRRRVWSQLIACGLFAVSAVGAKTALAQAAVTPGPQVQIPTLQVCNKTLLDSPDATVNIQNRAGGFTLKGNLLCDPFGNTPYPAGALGLFDVNMNDQIVPAGADIVFTTFEQVTSTGRRSPTMWVSGRCEVRKNNEVLPNFPGCHYWLMAADNTNPLGNNGKTPDIVSFLVFGKLGKRIAYGTGPVVEGDLVVAPTPN